VDEEGRNERPVRACVFLAAMVHYLTCMCGSRKGGATGAKSAFR
jgi:hypothetical protein